RMRNRGGQAIGLRVVDGTTIAPLLDYWGNSPEPPAEAYVQYANGLPWNWLTRKDLVYVPFRPRSNTVYGYAPLESILLNANTDLRFQAYFLQRFTEGNIPEAFASAPETWTPQQIEEFQGYWDAFMLGDQSVKHMIKWMPGGGKIEWSNEKDFSDSFSLFLMRKTCAAYHIVPSDLGFTESVNKSSGDSQADVQHRVGDRPLVTHIQDVLTSFLQHDMGLPIEFAFDTGQEKEDRLALAQAWQIYIEAGMASPDEGREELLGLPADPRRPTPRFFNTNRLGPVPLLNIDAVGGRIDPETYAPAEDQALPAQPFVPAPGVLPAQGTTASASAAAAEDAYQATVQATIAKETALAAAAGISADTGLHGYDLDT
ncbi:phage portal protein, partial [Streptomyces sp. NPDC005803]|uniref:phage portal protein n=1 Tax=Streptomyces sp. NPDC005803 TaxID=3154297 RepID=UPI0033D1141B